MGNTLRIEMLDDNGRGEPVRPWYGAQRARVIAAQKAQRAADRAARTVKYAQSTEDAAGVSFLLALPTTD